MKLASRKAKIPKRKGKDLAPSYRVFGAPGGFYGGLTRSTDNDGVVASYPLAYLDARVESRNERRVTQVRG